MKQFLKVTLTTLFCLSLLATLLCTAMFFMFRVQSVQNTLHRQGFYDSAMTVIENDVSNLQSIVNIETSVILGAVTKEDITPLLQYYTNGISRHLLENDTDTIKLTFSSEALYKVVCDTITPAQYDNDIAALEADRTDAYADLQASITDALAFFPQSLYTTLKELASKKGVPLNTVYVYIAYMRRLALPFAVLTLLSGAALLLCYRAQKLRGLRLLAGSAFIITSPLFLCGVLLRANPFMERLSLADGLLKDYISALLNSMGTGAFTVITAAFFLSLSALIAVILFEVFHPQNNTCTKT